MLRRWPMPIMLVLFCVAATVALGCADDDSESDAPEVTAKIIEYGRYSAAALGTVPTTDETSGGVHLITADHMHFKTTRKIPCQVGERFGFLLEVRGLEVGREYKFHMETRHPPIKQPDGRILKKSFGDQTGTAQVTEGVLYHGWCFENGYEYELIPGTWTLSVSIDDQAPVEMSFEVVNGNADEEPEDAPIY